MQRVYEPYDVFQPLFQPMYVFWVPFDTSQHRLPSICMQLYVAKQILKRQYNIPKLNDKN